MPLPNDEKLLALANDVLKRFDQIFGEHPGFRPAHAKGAMLNGMFIPTAEAKSLSRAPHFRRESTPVTVRFSDSTGLPLVPDNDPNANPRGMAIRFHLGERVHTDIVSHSTDGFPTHTGDEFLEMLTALASSGPDVLSPKPIEVFLGSHPSALAFVQTPKPAPSSFAREIYYGVTAMHFSNEDGATRYGRYRILPEAGNDHLDEAAAAAKGPDYLFDELKNASRRAKSNSASSCSWPRQAMRCTTQLSTGLKTGSSSKSAHWSSPRRCPTTRRSKSTSSSIPFRASMVSSLPKTHYWNCVLRYISSAAAVAAPHPLRRLPFV
jgi:hypothetical protein